MTKNEEVRNLIEIANNLAGFTLFKDPAWAGWFNPDMYIGTPYHWCMVRIHELSGMPVPPPSRSIRG